MQHKYLYRMVQVRNGEKTVKFRSTDLKKTLRFLVWYTKKYKEGLLLEILPLKKVYDTRAKVIKYIFE